VFLPPKACYALGIPLIAVDTLKILAAQAPVSDGLIIQ
jgi:tRNA threonylcarbamoyladenosine biosynthesis protein TsaB